MVRGWQLGKVARHSKRAFAQLQKLNLFLVFVAAEDEPLRRVLAWLSLVLVEPA